jgi:hypothetical protein
MYSTVEYIKGAYVIVFVDEDNTDLLIFGYLLQLVWCVRWLQAVSKGMINFD